MIYTANWEDPESDRLALRIRPGETLMTITSGACNTLGFLVQDPAVIYTVDINPTQAFHLELKMAAMKALQYGDFTAFLGLTPSRERLETYATLRGGMTPGAARIWDARRNNHRKGFLLPGGYETFVKRVGRYIRLGHGRKRVEGLLDAIDPKEQGAFYDRFWEIRRTRWVFRLFYNKNVLARMGLEADYFRFDDGSSSFAESFQKKFRKVAHDVPVRGNYCVHLYLKGRYRSLDEVPDYLREEHYETIRGRLGRIRAYAADNDKPVGDTISLEDGIRVMTLGGAYSMRKEKVLGSLEKGKAADMVVLNRNLFDIDPASIIDSKVVYTIFAGRIVYDAHAGTRTSLQPAPDTPAPDKVHREDPEKRPSR